MKTYTEAQYSTPAARAMIRDKFLPANPTAADVESAARYMSRSLRIGPLAVCRQMVRAAVDEVAER